MAPRLVLFAGLILVLASTLALTQRNKPVLALEIAEAVPVEADLIDCPDGFEAIAGRGCLAFAGAPGPLVIYLHGLYQHGVPYEEREEMNRQTMLAKYAKAQGFTVLALRGRVGACSAAQYARYVCWPSNERTQDAGAEVVSEWATPLRIAEDRSGHGKRYVLGFSNGGFFAGLIATHALLSLDAIAIAHAGPVEPFRPLGPKPPLLLLSADEDSSQEGMIHFDEVLTREAWPHELYARAEGGHSLPDVDISAALTFFERVERGERPPFSPPLSPHRPTPRSRDGSL